MRKQHIIQFIIMTIIGMCFNPMNALASDVNDIFTSLTLLYGGILMASNMVWGHELIHFLSIGHFNTRVFVVGICLSLFSTFLLRDQLFVDDSQWLRRMIGHHSTALTTSRKIYERTSDPLVKNLAKGIVEGQTKEISLMKSMLVK